MSPFRISSLAAALIAFATCAAAQIPAAMDQPVLGMEPGDAVQTVMDRPILAHAILNENEGRWNGSNTQYRWDGEGWVGTDYDKLWIKSEGTLQSNGTLEDGQQQFLYSRAITTYSTSKAGCAATSTRVQPAIGQRSAFRVSPLTSSMSNSPGM